MRLAIAVLWMSLLYPNIVHYLANKGISPIYPKHVVLLGIAMFAWAYSTRKISINRANEEFVAMNLAGVVLTLVFYVMTLFSSGLIDTTSLNDEFGILLFYSVVVVSLTVFSYRNVFRVAEKLLIAFFIFGVGMNLWDFVASDAELFSKTAGRASGMYMNPNTAGLVLSLTFILIHKSIAPQFRLIMFAALMLAVITTASRQGMLYLSLILIYLVSTGYFFRWTGKAIVVNLILALSVFAVWSQIELGTQKVLDEIYATNRALDARMTNFQELLAGDEQSVEVTEDGRFTLLVGHLRHYLESPLLGNGLGFSRSPQLSGFEDASHNQYIHMMNEYGILGLLFYVGYIFSAIGRRGLRLRKSNLEPHLLLFMLFLAGVFTHNLNRLYPVAILIGFAGAKYRVMGAQFTSARRQKSVSSQARSPVPLPESVFARERLSAGRKATAAPLTHPSPSPLTREVVPSVAAHANPPKEPAPASVSKAKAKAKKTRIRQVDIELV